MDDVLDDALGQKINLIENNTEYNHICCEYKQMSINSLLCNNSEDDAKDDVLDDAEYKNKNVIDKNVIDKNKYTCFCGKEYKYRQGLWKHKKLCNKKIINDNLKKSITQDVNNLSQPKNMTDLLFDIIKQNQDFQKDMQKQMLEFMKERNNTIFSNNTTTNSHNKTFNLNMFLNETCKNAMNLSDFANSIQLQLSDLESVGELGYVNGISNIIIKNLKELDITQRPIHCTDAKREILYIKDKDKWERESEQKEIIIKFVNNVANKNIRMLSEFKKKYPDCCKYESKYSDYYSKLIIEAMGGSGGTDADKNEKIIKKITKEVTIDKAIL
jgi:hypothetical protein